LKFLSKAEIKISMYYVCLTFDFDAYSTWIHRKMLDYSNLSRGEFAKGGRWKDT